MKYLTICIIWLSAAAAVLYGDASGGIFCVAAGMSCMILFWERNPKGPAVQGEEKEKEVA